MAFQYVIRAIDIQNWDTNTQSIIEARDRDLELYTVTIDTSFLNLNASNLKTGIVPSARITGAYTGITSVGTLSSLAVTGGVTASTFTGALTGNATTATNVAYSGLTGTVPTWNQNTTGNAATVTTNANLTGDVTSVGNATTLTNAPVIAKVLTGYTSGAGTVSATDSILEAIQKFNGNIVAMNGYGRGLMATPATSTTSITSITTEATMLTYTFTAVSGRSYLLVYSEPSTFGSISGIMTSRIRLTDVSGTVLNTSSAVITTSGNITMNRCEVVYKATASGSLTIVGTLAASTGVGQTQRSSTKFPQLYAIDIGIV